MRADRLVAILLLLQARGQLTVAQLAELLETSERTVRRDLDALCVAGVPLYSQRGRGGGWALLGRHRIDLTGFTAEEARALFLVAGSQPRGGDRVEPILRSALRKVLAALPEPLRTQAETATRSAVVDPVSWGRSAAEEPPFLDAVRTAVLDRVQVDLDYEKPGSAPARRRVHPFGLVAKGGVWYLLAGTDAGRRTFRLSRVRGLEVTDEPADVPDGLDLAREWANAQDDFRARAMASGVAVDVEVADGAVLWLTSSLDRWATVEEDGRPPGQPGWRRFTLTVPHVRAAASVLASLGADVRVLSPKAVRAELARIGRGLAEANAPT